ncbi:acyltransferase [Candidatus Woesearchaeota archaeon]|nr:acyltransferase [Candidatus Woesearchaeota archaeon]
MRVGLVQSKVTSDSEINLEKALAGVKKAAELGAEVVCLQELFAHPYVGIHKLEINFSLAEPIPGPLTITLSEAAKKNKVVLIGGSIFEREIDRGMTQYFNTAVVFSPQGKMMDLYRKIHIPNDSHYEEQFYFSSGNQGYKVVDTEQGKIGVGICYDQWFPEVSRALALEGAQVIFYPTAIGWTEEMKKKEKFSTKNWRDMQRMQAVANHVYVAAVNRVGKEKGTDFWGHSFVADPFGEILVKGSRKKDEVLVVSCDLAKIEEAKTWGFMKNRRPETYERLLKP